MITFVDVNPSYDINYHHTFIHKDIKRVDDFKISSKTWIKTSSPLIPREFIKNIFIKYEIKWKVVIRYDRKIFLSKKDFLDFIGRM